MGGVGAHKDVDDQFGNPEKAEGQNGSDYTKNNTQHHNRAARIPNNSQDRGHVPQSGNALPPSVPGILFSGHGRILRVVCSGSSGLRPKRRDPAPDQAAPDSSSVAQ